MRVLDAVVRAIEAELAAHAPERGGALVGPRGVPLVTELVPDPQAAATPSTYRPSRALDARVKALERDEGLELKGLVHSHPALLDAPSAQDVAELAEGLARNGHIAIYLAPIVTRGPGPLGPHELALPSGKISFFAARRTAHGPEVSPLRVAIVPLLRDAERLARELDGVAAGVTVVDVGDAALPAARVRADELELLVVVGDGYPTLPPLVLATRAGGDTEQLSIPWPLGAPEEVRLCTAVRTAVEPPGPYRPVYGPPGGPGLTSNPERARLAGWARRLAGGEPALVAEGLRTALLARGAGTAGDSLRERRVLVAGCGSVGSYVAEQLARSGVGALSLVDPETVEAVNLSRTSYEVGDVGRLKVEALARRLLAVQPALQIEVLACAVDALGPEALDAQVRAADLVVAATDDPAAQRALDRFAYGRGRPAVLVGLYAGAQGGEVVMTVPGRTPCYLCATRTRGALERAGGVAREVDYGTARLRGEIALGADVHHVASAAVKLGLSLLLAGSDAPLAGVAEGALAAGTPYLTLSTVAEYWFYPQVFGETPGQHAYQSVWLTPSPRADCPVCGDPAGRVDPRDVPLRGPRRDALQQALREDP
ncbi:ThiF family adenylyltransferase [Anaeromyxobacter sp. Fw109-5]|uniref:ThiF family adenylyltransferase n=1 Tax=Anaeromyxobacter sp. (strain Fw109-5) TaxID=404589 RepID=UPI0000ED7627|nr:ThiF family adenylyltransferase [Anaeromyxobacter sp. Fw109-5]ABS25871.1 UBA/THIF-type NAD/FAD binding protein [Anaeromyxobacter sp. Fw109-5]